MTETVSRYPLSWPRGWKRTNPSARVTGAFGKAQTNHYNGTAFTSKKPLTVAQALDRLLAELARLGARNVVVSTNLDVRLDGLPRSNQRAPDDPGAAVYFVLNKQDRCLACDRYTKVENNLAALAAHVQALRAIERHGVGTVDQAFAGYAALPPAAVDWKVVLGFDHATDPISLDEVEARYRELARGAHPDRGGTTSAMALLNQARDYARQELGL